MVPAGSAAMNSIRILISGGTFDMNGRALPWDTVRKNGKTGMFEEIEA